MNKVKILIYAILHWLFLSMSGNLFSQNCQISLKGIVKDTLNHHNVSNTIIELNGPQLFLKFNTENDGKFEFKNLCLGSYLLHIQHENCDHIDIEFDLKNDTHFLIYLGHLLHQLAPINVKKSMDNQRFNSFYLKTNPINSQSSSLGQKLDNLAGVSLLRIGISADKPIINGFHSQRVVIFNQGVKLESQNWGQDHAPEIDGNGFDNFEIIRNAKVLKYSNDGIGGLILLKNNPLYEQNQNQFIMIHGFNTNGRAFFQRYTYVNNFQIHNPIFYKINISINNIGNGRTPLYFIENTGAKNLSNSVEIEQKIKNFHWKNRSEYYYMKNGLFNQAFLGNTTDLKNQINNPKTYQNSRFSYEIDRPYQETKHFTQSISANYLFKNQYRLEYYYHFQHNNRLEYDKLRSSNSIKKAADFNYYLNTNTTGINFSRKHFHRWNFQIGYEFISQKNAMDGRFFIPGYIQNNYNGYLFISKNLKNFDIEFSYRNENRKLEVYLWNNNILKQENLYFPSNSSALSLNYDKKKKFKTQINLQYLQRAPSINELYSNGLHQGVARIEVGNPDLKTEKSLKLENIINLKSRKFRFYTINYVQKIDDFIRLLPDSVFALSIKGAFPKYNYKSIDALMYGNNSGVECNIINKILNLNIQSDFMIAKSIDNDKYLSGMPPFRLISQLEFKYKNSLCFIGLKKVFKQKFYNIEEEILIPSDGYFLLFGQIQTDFEIKKQVFNLKISLNNILRQKYYDYLNTYRIFTMEQDLSINFTLTTQLYLKHFGISQPNTKK